MSTDQGPDDVGGELGWEDHARSEAKPKCVVCGARNLCSTCDPAGFETAWLDELRRGVISGRIAGYPLRPDAVERGLAVLADHAVEETPRPGLRLPPSLERLSPSAREALAKTRWSGFVTGRKEDPERAHLDRIVAAMAALRIIRERLGVLAHPKRPFEPASDSPVEAEICRELVAARAWLFGGVGRKAA